MSKAFIPEDYKPVLDLFQTQIAIGQVKRIFEDNLCRALNLIRATCPLFVDPNTGLNDDLNGVETPVEFTVKETGVNVQIVHSLAKWKRMALFKYGFPVGMGLVTDMNAIRKEESLDNLHSVYVDQWDWEKVIDAGTRNVEYLKDTVRRIVGAICDTSDAILQKYPTLKTRLSREVSFVTTQQLEDMYPDLSPKEREHEYLKEHKTAFVMQIGGLLKSGVKHDGRAPDYDDWQLNGDILFWYEPLSIAMELSSMGIRVDAESLRYQLKEAGCEDRSSLPYHKALLNNELPYTIGGGIGQSRLCLMLLEKIHIGEVQASVWNDRVHKQCAEHGITLL